MVANWEVRYSERQTLLEELKRQTIASEEERGEGQYRFIYVLARVCLNFLQCKTMSSYETPESQFFLKTIFPTISEFSRAKEERDVLVVDFLIWLIESIALRFHRDLMHREIMEPETIFSADSANN